MSEELTEVAAPEVEDMAPEPVTDADEEIHAEGEEGEQPEPEPIEWELKDGRRVKVDAALKDDLERGRDATRKWQEAADMRRQNEALQAEIDARARAVQQAEQVSQQERQIEIQMQVLQQRAVAEFNPEQMARLAAEDPAGYVLKQSQLEQLRAQFQHMQGLHQQAKAAREWQTQQLDAQARQRAQAELARVIPGWAPDNDLDRALLRYGLENDYSPEELRAIAMSPKRAARLYREFKADQAAKAIKTAQKTQPAPAKPTATVSGRASPSRMPSDSDDVETWMRKERARMAKNGR